MVSSTTISQISVDPATLQLSSGCTVNQKSYGDGVSKNFSIPSSGGNRFFSVRLPVNYNYKVPYPLIISYHGGTKTKEEQEQLSRFSNSSINPNMIAV